MRSKPLGIAAIIVAVIAGLVLALTAPAQYLVEVAKIPDEIARAPENNTTITPPVAPFYDVDLAQLPEAPAGTLIKAEEITGAPTGVKTFRIMYHSRDLKGNDLPVTGLFTYPVGEVPNEGLPLISYAHGTTGVGRACGMSQTPFLANTPGYSHYHQQILPMVEEGWAVVATDFSGMGAPGPSSYLVGDLEGQNMLDSLRAVLASDPSTGSVKIDPNRLGTYGKSQGGSAVLSMLEIAPDYAPELDIKGGMALALGLVVPIPGVIELVAGNPTSTSQNMFMLLIAKSYADNYPDLVDIEDVLTPEGISRLPLLAEYCGSDLASRVDDVPLSEMLKTPIDRGLITAMYDAMPGSVPLQQPAVVTQGLKDKTILPEFAHGEVQDMCAWGDTVWYQTYPDDDHPSIPYQSRKTEPHIYQWMTNRFNGEPAPSNCPNKVW
jgi:hypothetical protein